MDAEPRFPAVPAAVAGLLGAADALPALPGLPERVTRVLVLLLDAFGWRFVERYADHPLLRRIGRDGTVTPMRSQFPSTTTGHVTTMHTGLPVTEHGLYEWHVLEPAFGRVVVPLRLAVDGGGADSIQAAGLDPAAVFPPSPTLYERLAAAGAESSVHQPARFSPSTFDRIVTHGATLVPFDELDAGLRTAAASLARRERGYAYVYFDLVDTQGHLTGPASADFDARARDTLDRVEAALFGPGAPVAAQDTWLLLTADHGQIDVDPDRMLWLDELHPPLRDLALGPAGSARDVFLHVPPEDVDATVAGLRAVLGDAAEVLPVADLLAQDAFGPDPGPRLLDRLASVCVLPEPGRMAWLRGFEDRQCTFRGHHGGRTPEESQTHLSVLRLG